jgi:hypothetical protein
MLKILKKNKLSYYIEGLIISRFPVQEFSKKINQLKKKLTAEELSKVDQRVSYYNKLNERRTIIAGVTIKDLEKPKTPKSYYFDTYQFAKHFPKSQPINFLFGDITDIPSTPSIVKSRPIADNNQNSILLNLDKARHFIWVSNDKEFKQKKDFLIGRGAIFGNQKNRIDFYTKYFNHALCNLGQTNDYENNEWKKPKISIEEHLDYKFILSLQGNDVATNLKWIMSSNSIAVMPKPTMETWFMEGKLIAGKHYIEIKDDFSDLEEQLNFFLQHPDKCAEIIQNAHEHCAQFFNKGVERLTSLLVLEKYFKTKGNNQ